MVMGGQERGGFPAADGQLGLHSCLVLFVDIGCPLRAEGPEGSSPVLHNLVTECWR